MKDTLWQTPTSVTRIHRDNHDESGKYTVESTEFDDHILAKNQRLRLEDMMPSGTVLPGIDGSVELAFRIPPVQYSRMQKDMPDIWDLLQSRDAEDNKRGARKLAILHPEWVVTSANR